VDMCEFFDGCIVENPASGALGRGLVSYL
jgi:hypothetical protein